MSGTIYADPEITAAAQNTFGTDPFGQAYAQSGLPAAAYPFARAMQTQESGIGASGAPNNPMRVITTTAADPGYGVAPLSEADRNDPTKSSAFALQLLSAKANHAGLDMSDPADWPQIAKLQNGGGDPSYWQHVAQYIPSGTSSATFSGVVPGGSSATADAVAPIVKTPMQSDDSVQAPSSAMSVAGQAPKISAPATQLPDSLTSILDNPTPKNTPLHRALLAFTQLGSSSGLGDGIAAAGRLDEQLAQQDVDNKLSVAKLQHQNDAMSLLAQYHGGQLENASNRNNITAANDDNKNNLGQAQLGEKTANDQGNLGVKQGQLNQTIAHQGNQDAIAGYNAGTRAETADAGVVRADGTANVDGVTGMPVPVRAPLVLPNQLPSNIAPPAIVQNGFQVPPQASMRPPTAGGSVPPASTGNSITPNRLGPPTLPSDLQTFAPNISGTYKTADGVVHTAPAQTIQAANSPPTGIGAPPGAQSAQPNGPSAPSAPSAPVTAPPSVTQSPPAPGTPIAFTPQASGPFTALNQDNSVQGNPNSALNRRIVAANIKASQAELSNADAYSQQLSGVTAYSTALLNDLKALNAAGVTPGNGLATDAQVAFIRRFPDTNKDAFKALSQYDKDNSKLQSLVTPQYKGAMHVFTQILASKTVPTLSTSIDAAQNLVDQMDHASQVTQQLTQGLHDWNQQNGYNNLAASAGGTANAYVQDVLNSGSVQNGKFSAPPVPTLQQWVQAKQAQNSPGVQAATQQTFGSAQPITATTSRTPSPAALQYLKNNPNTAAQFDEYFGQGSAAKYSTQ